MGSLAGVMKGRNGMEAGAVWGQKERGGRKSEACRIRRSDGVIVGKNEEIREVWKSF